jgi:hypothetical protein
VVGVAAPRGVAAVVSLAELAGSPAAAMHDPACWLAAAGEDLASRSELLPAGQ